MSFIHFIYNIKKKKLMASVNTDFLRKEIVTYRWVFTITGCVLVVLQSY